MIAFPFFYPGEIVRYDPLNDQINGLQRANTNTMNAVQGLGSDMAPWESMARLPQQATKDDLYQALRDQLSKPAPQTTYSPPVPQPEPAMNPVLLLLE